MSGLPFKGIRVLDISNFWAGPFAGQFLGDLGAEVFKIEAIQHMDPFRNFANLPQGDAEAARLFYEWSARTNGANRNKYGLTLNLRDSKGRDLFLRLVAISDIVIENFSTRVMTSLELDYPFLRAANPSIIMVSMPGYGSTGPYKDYVSYAHSLEDFVGITSGGGYPGGPPVRYGLGMADPIAGMFAAVAIVAAVEQRDRSGSGQHVEVAQAEALTTLMAEDILTYQIQSSVSARQGNRSSIMSPHGVYPCKGKEKWIAIAVQSDEQWRSLCDVLGQREWLEQSTFATARDRKEHEDELDQLIAEVTTRWESYDLMHSLQRAGAPAAVVADGSEPLSDPHWQGRGFFQPMARKVTGTHPYNNFPGVFSNGRPPLRLPAPTLGEHNAVVLRELLGLNDQELSSLAHEKVIGTVPLGLGM